MLNVVRRRFECRYYTAGSFPHVLGKRLRNCVGQTSIVCCMSHDGFIFSGRNYPGNLRNTKRTMKNQPAKSPTGSGSTIIDFVWKVILKSFAFSALFPFFIDAKPREFETQASWYGDELAGRRMANGQRFDPSKLTCASWDFPLGTKLKISNKNRSVFVTVTDRGPAKRLYQKGRKIDLSEFAFKQLAPLTTGIIRVRVEHE